MTKRKIFIPLAKTGHDAPDTGGPDALTEAAGGGADRTVAPAPDADIREKSRSQKKRESTALQQRGEALAALSPALRAKLPLSPELAEALQLWRGMKSREARRRHLQYIGRLMREAGEDTPGLPPEQKRRLTKHHGKRKARTAEFG